METSLEKRVSKRASNRAVQLGPCLCSLLFLFGVNLPSQAAEIFQTLEVWERPRFFVIGDWSADLKSFKIWNDAKSFVDVPVSRSGSCPNSLNSRDLANFEIRRDGNGEILRGQAGSLAISFKPNVAFDVIHLSSVKTFNDCELSFRINLRWTEGESGVEPRVIFSDDEHIIAGHSVFVEEDVWIAGLRYEVEALSGLKYLKFGGASYFSPILNASFRATVPGLQNLFGEFKVGQSIKSFPKEVSFSSWEAKIGPQFLVSYRYEYTFSPYIFIGRDFVLTEQSLSLPEGADNILSFGIGAGAAVEFLQYWILKTSAAISLLSSNSSENVKWRNVLFHGAIGYRLSPQFRLYGDANFKMHTSSSSEKIWGGEMGLRLEMEF